MKKLLLTLRINRNIVECKSRSRKKAASMNGRINRNIVECKSHRMVGHTLLR